MVSKSSLSSKLQNLKTPRHLSEFDPQSGSLFLRKKYSRLSGNFSGLTSSEQVSRKYSNRESRFLPPQPVPKTGSRIKLSQDTDAKCVALLSRAVQRKKVPKKDDSSARVELNQEIRKTLPKKPIGTRHKRNETVA